MLIGTTGKLLSIFITVVLISSCDNDRYSYASATSQGPVAQISESDLNIGSSSRALSFTLSIDRAGLADDKVLLKSELINNSSQKVVFLPWGTPFENAITADFLTIINVESGEKLSYQGVMLKRRPPRSEDYLGLEPGESIESILDVSRSYNFCPGSRYTIKFSSALHDSEYKPLEIHSNSVEIDLRKNFKSC